MKKEIFPIYAEDLYNPDPYSIPGPIEIFSRSLYSLNSTEKGLPLMEELVTLLNTHLPSENSLLRIVESYDVVVAQDSCSLRRKTRGRRQAIQNLGTEKNPAFLYNNYIFALDRERGGFFRVEPRLVFRTEKNALLHVIDDLLILYTSDDGFEVVGNFSELKKEKDGSYHLHALISANSLKYYEINQNFKLRAIIRTV
ncbi:MAG: hypothetical protein J6039_05990 [Alphaproteobacteria bacterium]|nr:hypothetical protein [Alphaproteobacteria bacterium]